MSQTTKIGEFIYCTRVLEASQTATHYGETAEFLRNNPNAWYAMWMNSRRHSEYDAFAKQQRTELHKIAMHINSDPVCSCGLIVKLQASSGETAENQLLLARGHLNSKQEKLVHCFFIKQRASNSGPWVWHLFCQSCLTATATSGVANTRQKELAVFRGTHEQCKGEN